MFGAKNAHSLRTVIFNSMHFRAAKPHKSAIEYSTYEWHKTCCFKIAVCQQAVAQNEPRIISRLNLAELEKVLEILNKIRYNYYGMLCEWSDMYG